MNSTIPRFSCSELCERKRCSKSFYCTILAKSRVETEREIKFNNHEMARIKEMITKVDNNKSLNQAEGRYPNELEAYINSGIFKEFSLWSY